MVYQRPENDTNLEFVLFFAINSRRNLPFIVESIRSTFRNGINIFLFYRHNDIILNDLSKISIMQMLHIH